MIEHDVFAQAVAALLAQDQAEGAIITSSDGEPDKEWWLATGIALALVDPDWARRITALQHETGCYVAKLVFAGMLLALSHGEPMIHYLTTRYGHGHGADPAASARSLAQDIPRRFPL